MSSHSHCPIIYNCIGVNNARHFILFLFVLNLSTILFIHLDTTCKYCLIPTDQFRLHWACNSHSSRHPDILSLPPYGATCRIVSKPMCDFANRDTFPFLILIWAIGQCIFVTSLCVSQALLILSGATTKEIVKFYRERRQRLKNQAELERRHQSKFWRTFKMVTGIEALLALTTKTRNSSRSRFRSPYTVGSLQNCRDFLLGDSSYAEFSTCFSPRKYVGFDTGNSFLAGRRVNYHEFYDMPAYLPETRSRGLQGEAGAEVIQV